MLTVTEANSRNTCWPIPWSPMLRDQQQRLSNMETHEPFSLITESELVVVLEIKWVIKIRHEDST